MSMHGNIPYHGLLDDVASLVTDWRDGAVRCFDGNASLVRELQERRDRIFGSLQEELSMTDDLQGRCELLSGMFAVAVDASSVPDPEKEDLCRELAEQTLFSPECGEYLQQAMTTQPSSSDSRVVAAVRKLAEDFAWPDEPADLITLT